MFLTCRIIAIVVVVIFVAVAVVIVVVELRQFSGIQIFVVIPSSNECPIFTRGSP